MAEVLCRPRAALGSNYSERPISAPFPRVSRVGVQSAVIYGRKLDKRASASRPIGRRLLRESLFQADGTRLPTTANSAPEPRQLAGEEISPRRARGLAMYDNGVATASDSTLSDLFFNANCVSR